MIKAIISSFWFFLIAYSAYAMQPTLESFHIIGVSKEVENVIFTFNKIDSYRFIMLSNDYWYIAVPQKRITIDTPINKKLSINDILIRDIRDETRIYVRMNPNYTYKYSTILSKNGKYLIIRAKKELIKQQLLKKPKPALKTKPVIKQKTTTTKQQNNKTIKPKQFTAPPKGHRLTIVIDPGHGGKDPGAVGIYNKEKNVVLDIAHKTAKYLKKYGYRVILTRTGDTYPTLSDRSRLSNNVKADLFISIHANYAVKDRRNAKGLEVYFLNITSDKRAIALAARENGVSTKEIGDINKIVLSLIQSAKIEKSKILALDVYNSMLKEGRKIYSHYKGRGVKQAPFYVLVDTRCPSILIETAFINNRQDARKLKSATFRQHLAIGIARGIEQYINLHLKNKISH